MTEPFRIGDRVIDARHPLIVPEIGINHGGDAVKAMEMVYAACDAGAEVVKLQTHVPGDELLPGADKVYPPNAGGESIASIIHRCALSEDDESALKEAAEDLGMIYLSTPFSPAAVDRLERMGVVAYKIGSGESRNSTLVRYVASKGKPIIASTGMSHVRDSILLRMAASRFDVPLCLLHCVSKYPTPAAEANLGRMDRLRAVHVHVGYSDHCEGNAVAMAALARGAILVEKHFRMDGDEDGPDMACSMTPGGLRQLIDASREIAEAIAAHAEEDVQEETLSWVQAAKRYA